EVHDLQAGMHAAVGPSRGADRERRPGDGGERRLERVLHRAAPRLGLPAEKAAAVVFEAESDAGHWRKSGSTKVTYVKTNSGSDPDFQPSLVRSCCAWPFCAA